MINTMRLKYLYTILLLCCVNICFAQNKLFDKYADMDDVTSVYISKKMFQMMIINYYWILMIMLIYYQKLTT